MKWLFIIAVITTFLYSTGKISFHFKPDTPMSEISLDHIPRRKLEAKKTPSSTQPTFTTVEVESEETFLPAAQFNENRFRERLENTPYKCASCNIKTARYFRAQDPREVSIYFVDELRRLGSSDLFKRTRLIEIANLVNSDELLPLWRNILYRETPLDDSEAALLAPGVNSPKAIRIYQELSSAVENIGAIAFRDSAAKNILIDIISKPTLFHRGSLRYRAMLSLEDADSKAAVNVLKKLPPDDDLRLRFKTEVKAD